MPNSVPTARAALRALSVADHSRVRQDGPGRCRANFFFPIDALVVSLADYMTSWGAVCQPVAYVYSSEWHLLSILQGQLGLCTASGGNGTRSSDDIALVVPQRMHDGTMAPLHSCVDSPAVWIFSTEQFSNPLYLRKTILLALQRAGVRLVVANGLPSTRDAVVASARVLVNIHGNDEQTMFETMRCDRWIAAGHVVVSEPS
ncbi:hypothetical protein FNF29_04099 [Cafeteria roenbergensis]|uniref:Uncharacterized protein n=1 Tax=Cafeteria roenbergensis TaxID=33653 RepID=A0A5A8CGQ5_CAFRO|nr:hypothetical protein FNF29_04099 [Cafeteria roenbergensis]|eukprot:KAA0152235.1 hypothetical protein FNF29_04099 [Cafeteria roenbergensis]